MLQINSASSGKPLPKDLTSYDFFKAVAVILMIVDHIGYYFFPENEEWWRTFGRMCVPIWFFLVGYAQSRDLGPKLWIGGTILVAANILSGMYIMPLNILFTILFCRILLDNTMRVALTNLRSLAATTFVLTVLIIPTAFLFEYGSQALMMAMFGWMVRHQKESRSLHKDSVEFFLIANILVFIGFQTLFFGLDNQQAFVLAIGTFLSFGFVWLFKPKTYPKLTKSLPGFVTWFFKLLGRRTLEIYVLHLLLFKALGMYLNPERFSFLDWQLFVI